MNTEQLTYMVVIQGTFIVALLVWNFVQSKQRKSGDKALEDKYNQLSSEHQQLKGKHTLLSESHEKLQNDHKELKAIINNDVIDDILKMYERIKKILDNSEKHLEDIIQIKKHGNRLVEHLKHLIQKVSKSELMILIRKCEKGITLANENNKELLENLEFVRRAFDKLEGYRRTVDNYQEDVEDYQDDVEDYNEKVEDFSKLAREAQERCERHLRRVKEYIDSVEKIDDIEDDVDSIEDRLRELEEDSSNDSNHQVDDLVDELSKLRRLANTFEEQIEILKMRCETIESRM